MTIRYAQDDVRPMGRSTAGVRGMKMKTGDEVVSCDVARDDTAILIVTDGGYGKRTQLDKFNQQGRGGQGVRGIKLNAKKGFVVAAFMVAIDDEILAIASTAVVTRAWRSVRSRRRGRGHRGEGHTSGIGRSLRWSPVLAVDDGRPGTANDHLV